MSDDVKRVAERILDRTKGQVRTHSTDCHEYHLECFAAFMLQNMEAAQSVPLVVESREALGRAIFPYSWDSPDEQVRQVFQGEGLQLADEIIASGVVRLAADVVREAKAEAWEDFRKELMKNVSEDGLIDQHLVATKRNPYRTEGENQ